MSWKRYLLIIHQSNRSSNLSGLQMTPKFIQPTIFRMREAIQLLKMWWQFTTWTRVRNDSSRWTTFFRIEKNRIEWLFCDCIQLSWTCLTPTRNKKMFLFCFGFFSISSEMISLFFLDRIAVKSISAYLILRFKFILFKKERDFSNHWPYFDWRFKEIKSPISI